MIKSKEMENFISVINFSLTGHGSRTSVREELNTIRTKASIKVILKTIKDMEPGHIPTQISQIIKGNGRKIKNTALEHTSGKMAQLDKDIG